MRSLALLPLLVAHGAEAWQVAPDCNDWYLRQAGNVIELRCQSTPKAKPWLSFDKCPSAKARRDRATGITTVSCGGFSVEVLPQKVKR